MFDFFKSKNKNSQSISIKLDNIIKQKPNNLHIMVYIKDQVLFQIMPAKNFIEYGFVAKNLNDFVILHFFNKNKTLTFDKREKINKSKADYFYYENPKNNFNYLKTVGQNPKKIEDEIQKCMVDIYELENLNQVSIEYIDY